MKSSFCTNIFRNEEIPEAVRKLADMGYDGLEFWDQYLKVTDIAALKKNLLDNGIKASQLCPYFDFVNGNKKWDDSVTAAGRYIKLAGELECGLIRVFTGWVPSAKATAEQRSAAVRGLQTICDMAKNLCFVLEAHPNCLMDTAVSLERLLNEADRPNLKINLQVPLMDGLDPIELAERLGRHVAHLHAHNWHYEKKDLTRQWDVKELTCLDSGDYDFSEFIRIIRAQGFDGYISIEHGDHGGKDNPFAVAGHEIEYLRKKIFPLK